MEDSRIEYVQMLLTDSREELSRADAKISILLGAAGVGASVIVGDIASGHWVPTILSIWAQVLWWIGTSAAAVGFVALTHGLTPRIYESGDRERLLFFGHVAQFSSARDLFEPLNRASDKILQMKVAQLWAISRIVARKYALVRVSLAFFAIAAVLLMVAKVAG